MNPQRVQRASQIVRQRVVGQPWFRGITQSVNPPSIVVYVSQVHPSIPARVGSDAIGVPITLRVVGDIEPLGAVGAPVAQCPACGAPLSMGYVRSPENPFEGSVPIDHQAAALSTQKAPQQSFHPAFYIMAAASVTGVVIELARYLREKK